MQHTTSTPTAELDERPSATPRTVPGEGQRGCLFALSQPPLMLFLTVIGALLAICGAHDLFWL
ncbi:hypothetical protein [Streptomyces sp. JJ36]|uniref:hypothetical protein n=1 Tax=Streptomyces sp. JJ36 TaxID=2736645 RepID=UPI001F350E07|nr:hypothetical protein [Streptomyces sp. JJ36]MCF6525289.1 hypothetical protein [Streptomyces sp. JJ36]